MEAAPVRSLLLFPSSLLAKDGEAVIAVAVVGIAVAAHVGRKDVVIGVVRQDIPGVDRGGDSSGGGGGHRDLVDWGRGLKLRQTASGRGLEGGEELSLGSSNVSGIVEELVGDLLSLDVIVYRGKGSMLASKSCVKCGLELCLGQSDLGGVLEEARSSGSYSNNKDLKL